MTTLYLVRHGESECNKDRVFTAQYDANGESVQQLCDRVFNELETICIENDKKTILVSTHATPIRAFLTKVKTGSIANMKDMPWVLNASVTKLTYENSRFKVDFENEVTHLNGLLTFLPENI